MPAGRPLKFQSVEDLNEKIEQYFKTEGKDKPTFTGLALYLDTDRETLMTYKDREEFSDSVKKAKTRVEVALEQHLYGQSVAGLIFNLKNNFGWRDRNETELTGKDGAPLFQKVEIESSGLLDDVKDV